MPNVQEYIDQNYPKDERPSLLKLDLSNQILEGILTLEIKEFPSLKEIDCSSNQISGINFITGKTRKAKKQKLAWELKKLNLANNDFKQDLSFLEELTELEELNLSNNKLFGSLEPLKNVTKLKKLDISATDIDSGLEYLPENLRKICCFSGMRENAKVKEIAEIVVSLFRAVKENNVEGTKEIIKEKKVNNLNFYDEHGNTLLHYATQKDNLPLLKFLVRSGSSVNAADEHGWSVLHSAALWVINGQGDWDVIEWLLENGADTDAMTDNNLTARDIFFRKDYSYIEQYDNLVDKVFQQTQVLVKER